VKDLTAKQRRVLEILQAAYRREESVPTYAEMASRLGVTVRAVFQHVRALERRGLVRRSRRHRGITLAAEVRPEIGMPVVGRVAAGRPLLAIENIDEYIRPPGFLAEEGIFALRVQGDSMTGRGIRDGDYALVRSTGEIRDGEVGVFVIGEEATVKTARYRRGRRLELHPENPAYPVIRPGEGGEEVRLAGRVVGVYRQV
jgi:repressor LexA